MLANTPMGGRWPVQARTTRGDVRVAVRPPTPIAGSSTGLDAPPHAALTATTASVGTAFPDTDSRGTATSFDTFAPSKRAETLPSPGGPGDGPEVPIDRGGGGGGGGGGGNGGNGGDGSGDGTGGDERGGMMLWVAVVLAAIAITALLLAIVLLVRPAGSGDLNAGAGPVLETTVSREATANSETTVNVSSPTVAEAPVAPDSAAITVPPAPALPDAPAGIREADHPPAGATASRR
ncbi:MAG: hypothetical protein ACTH31_10215 [Pseudoclavibacter sp.]